MAIDKARHHQVHFQVNFCGPGFSGFLDNGVTFLSYMNNDIVFDDHAIVERTRSCAGPIRILCCAAEQTGSFENGSHDEGSEICSAQTKGYLACCGRTALDDNRVEVL